MAQIKSDGLPTQVHEIHTNEKTKIAFAWTKDVLLDIQGCPAGNGKKWHDSTPRPPTCTARAPS